MLFLARIFNVIFNLLEFSIFIDVIISWVYRESNTFTDIIHTVTEPLLAPGRKIQDKLMPGSPMDFSPILALVLIRIIRTIVNNILLGIF